MTFFLKAYLVFVENFEMMMHSEMESRVQQKRSLQRTRRKKEQEQSSWKLKKIFFQNKAVI